MKTVITVSCLTLLLIGVISCEKDFIDIGSSIINNNEFNVKDTILEVVVTEKPVTSVRADGFSLGGALGQYLLGVYNNANYEKIEASVISQLLINPIARVVDMDYGADTTVVTKIDTVYLKLPYQSTLRTDGSNEYDLDSIIGNRNAPFNLNIYQISTFLNTLNPMNPAVSNSFQSNAVYQTISAELNADVNYQFIPKASDTIVIVSRKLHDGSIYDKDTIKLTRSIPFARVPLKNDLLKQLFLDRYQTADFATQEAFNNYFRGILLEASGNTGSLISFNFNNPTTEFVPSIEIYYTNTVLASGAVIDTIKKNDSFRLSGVRNSIYKMTPNNPSPSGSFQIQGTAGSHADITVFGPDANNNNLSDQIEALRPRNWLINDVSLTFHINQDIVGFDTIATPFRLFLYKNGEGQNLNPSQIKDILSEGTGIFGGILELTTEKKPDKYTFRITDYVSDLLSGATNYLPPLTLKVFNPTDIPTNNADTIVNTYNWNPKAVMLLNHLPTNGDRRAQLKISYSEKINN
ncbi:MAG: DUF4270 family protein [Flavobacteriaceae bacterium]|nr:MAG: DUF4270 family protein [Flavobacteriaceae bacterium]